MQKSFISLPNTIILSPLVCFSKKRLFEEVANHAAFIIKAPVADIVRSLNEREKFGSTALKNGIAIPHVQMRNIKETFCILTLLQNKIFFNDVDTDPEDADIIMTFFFSGTENQFEAEKLLQNISEIFENEELCASLRHSKGEPDTIAYLLKKVDVQLTKRLSLKEL